VDALERAGIRFVIARHENAAGFMAEGAYRATGAPGVLVATVGPGVANGLNSVANAEQERVPLIYLTGKVPESETLSYTHQIFDHQAALRPFVKASFEARDGACDHMIDKAISTAMALRPGPVHIDLPIPVAQADHAPHRAAPEVMPTLLRPADGPTTKKAQNRFENAKRPLILVGQDVLIEEGSTEAVTAFARKHNIPVITTYKAKGVMPENDPLCLGGHGLSPKSDAIILPLLGQSDCVICAGYDPIEMRVGWKDPRACRSLTRLNRRRTGLGESLRRLGRNWMLRLARMTSTQRLRFTVRLTMRCPKGRMLPSIVVRTASSGVR